MAGPGRSISPRHGPVHSRPIFLGPRSGRRRQRDMNRVAGDRVDPARGQATVAAVAGLYAITPEDTDTDRLARKVNLALAGGARLIQYRSKSLHAAARRAQAERLL